MNESEFQEIVDQTIQNIQDAIDDSGADIDYDEVGGVLTHGAVVAREYGIPAIVGVRDAMKTLQTGQRVRVDGKRGIIEIL